jgi:hypothetical protein
LQFGRSAIYKGFQRLARKGLLQRVEEKPLRYRIADRRQAEDTLLELWEQLMPPSPAPLGTSRKIHNQLVQSLRNASRSYVQLPSYYQTDLKDAMATDRIMGLPFADTASSREMVTLKDAKILESRVKTLWDQSAFASHEERAKAVPMKSRPPGWRSPRWDPPPLVQKAFGKEISHVDAQAAIPFPSLATEATCSECGAHVVFDKDLLRYFCTQCGLEQQ